MYTRMTCTKKFIVFLFCCGKIPDKGLQGGNVLAYSLREYGQSWRSLHGRGSSIVVGVQSWDFFFSFLKITSGWKRKQENGQEVGIDYQLSGPIFKTHFLQQSLHLLKFPQFSDMVAPAEGQVFKRGSSWVRFSIQNTTQGKQFLCL